MTPTKTSLYEFFLQYAAERGNDTFLFDETETFTVAESFAAICSMANTLTTYGVKVGDLVGVRAHRSIETVLIFFALQFIGAVAVMHDSREPVEESISFIDGVLCVGGTEIVVHADKKFAGFDYSNVDVEAASIVVFTSGSTGVRKGVMLSQYNFVNNSVDTRGIGGYCDDDICMLIVPMCHVFGIALVVTAVVNRHSVFIPSSLDAEHLLKCIVRYGVTRLNGVPSTYIALAENKGETEISSLRCGLIGGGPCSKQSFVYVEQTLGLTLIPVYGMSECVGISCASVNDSIEQRCEGVGKVYSMNELRLLDDEILVKSPARAVGYMGEPPFDKNSWLHTGDLGKLDKNGTLHIVGRKKDIIIRNGNNLSVAEIERKIATIDGVKRVCVVAVPDEKQGEVPCALVVANKSIEDNFSEVLQRNEIPTCVEYVATIPLTTTGKPDKQAIVKMFEKQQI